MRMAQGGRRWRRLSASSRCPFPTPRRHLGARAVELRYCCGPLRPPSRRVSKTLSRETGTTAADLLPRSRRQQSRRANRRFRDWLPRKERGLGNGCAKRRQTQTQGSCDLKKRSSDSRRAGGVHRLHFLLRSRRNPPLVFKTAAPLREPIALTVMAGRTLPGAGLGDSWKVSGVRKEERKEEQEEVKLGGVPGSPARRKLLGSLPKRARGVLDQAEAQRAG